jgi:hypothetical protein
MRKLAIVLGLGAAIFLGTSGQAHAQQTDGQSDSAMGIGAETILNASLSTTFDIGAATFHYEAPKFHIDGLLLFLNVADVSTSFGLGGRFFYTLHKGDRADFNLGGGLIILNTDPEVGNSSTDAHVEFAAKIRVWLTSNVAIHSLVGLSILLADNDGGAFGGNEDTFGLFGQLNGAVGITYLFR